MNDQRRGARLWVGLLALGLILALVGLGGRALAQEQPLLVKVAAPQEEVSKDSGNFDVDVLVEGAENLGAFQFRLDFDDSILGYAGVREGPFLGSSGRTVECLDPIVGSNFVQFACVTLGPRPDGPNGSGVLAHVTLTPKGSGTSALTLSEVQITFPNAELIPASLEDGSVTIVGGGGFPWLIWGPVIGVVVVVAVGALAYGALRMRGRAASA